MRSLADKQSLQDEALHLVELDRRVIRAVVEQNKQDFLTALEDYLALRKRLKVRLLDESALTVEDAEAAAVLRKISGNDALQSDKVIARLASHIGDNNRIEEFDEEEMRQLGGELFYSWFSHHEYISALAELRPMVLRGPVPQSVSRLVRQVKDCYAFQQYDAAYGLCRMLIEASVRDICVRRKLFPDLTDNAVLYERHSWGELRAKVSAGALRERLSGLYGELSELLHARKMVTDKEARSAFDQTLEVIEELYAANGL